MSWKESSLPTKVATGRRVLFLRTDVTSTMTILWLVPFLVCGLWTISPTGIANRTPETIATNGSEQWTNDTRVTKPVAERIAAQQTQFAVDPTFASYYAAHSGSFLLGNAITPAYPVAAGWIQFFASGALLKPSISPAHALSSSSSTDAGLQALAAEGMRDPATGIIKLPLLHVLLSKGSLMPIAGQGSSLTFASLRAAVQPLRMVSAPSTSHQNSASSTVSQQPVFIAGGKRSNEIVGHYIPVEIWNALQEPSISPDGWKSDYGPPLSEAIPFTQSVNGVSHHFLVQVFGHGALILDTTQRPGAGGAAVQRLATGTAYLTTFGLPQPAIQAHTPVWTAGNTGIFASPSGAEIAHTGQNFPVALTGISEWQGTALWYQVTWSAGHQTASGWIPAASVTFASPGNQPGWASFDALSPALQHYLTSQGTAAGAVVYDVTHNIYYTYNADNAYTMASSAKVPIMLAFMRMLQQQNRGPNDQEMYWLTTMIENSDNNSAQALFDEIGGANGMSSLMRAANIAGLQPNPDAWGWSTTSPMAMVRLLTALEQGGIVNAQNRALALQLMQNIEPDQRIGVGDTAPQGATVALKDGWVPAPNGLWAVNSSGIVTVGQQTYVIAVYSQDQQDLGDGWNITRTVADGVAKALG